MIIVIVTSRTSALRRELMDRHFSPCSTLPTLPTTSTETWLVFKVLFLMFQNIWISLSQEGWNEISFQLQIVWSKQDFYCLTGGQRESLIIVSLLPFREVSPRWNQDFFWTQNNWKVFALPKKANKLIVFRIFDDAKTQASSIPDCGILVELFVDTSGTLLLNCAHNTQEINRVISFLFKWDSTLNT